jgi:protein TonB
MVVVDEEGRVSAISVAASSGADRLDKAALNAVRRWRWSPTMIDGDLARYEASSAYRLN